MDTVTTASSSVQRPDEDSLIPVRMLNEFTYCPRLGYLEWVDGEWAENLETRQGTFGHRNVDLPDKRPLGTAEQPDAETPPAPGPATASAESGFMETFSPSPEVPPATTEAVEPTPVIHARSLTLSAPREGLLAKMDLVEVDGLAATPVDYKRGSVPEIPEGAYEPERVQLCAQGLILQENGFHCEQGIIYFIASRRRVVIPFTPELIARTRQLAQDFRSTADQRQIPPPLVDSPKCPRCSLVGICLPDEVHLLQQLGTPHVWDHKPGVASSADLASSPDRPPTVRAQPRRLIPSRDDALPLYLQEYGLSLGKSGERLVVKKKSQEIKSLPIKDVSQVCVYGSVYTSEPALRELATRGIPLCHFSYGGWFYAVTTGLVHKNVGLRIMQYGIAAESGPSLELARQFIVGKIKNCRTMLRRHMPDDGKEKLLWQLAEHIDKARSTTSAESLLGIEGNAARLYFSGLRQLLRGDPDFDIDGRNRRPPRDPINALLSFLYSLLTKDLTITLQAVGFDPLLGVFHQPRYGKPALALDLAEEFRPLIADSTMLTLVNNREVQSADFISRAGAVALTDAARRAVLAAYERRMQSEITHPIFGYKLSYRRTLEVQARLLARTMQGELPEYPAFCTR